MSNEKILHFLTRLAENNSLDWMHQHKQEKDEATNDFIQLITQLQNEISLFDSPIIDTPASKLVFRLNRDIRFSHDKSPYNPTFRAHLGPNGKIFIPVGYFIQLAPEGKASFLGGGMFGTQFPNATAMIREYLLAHPKEFLTIINDKEFKKKFEVLGEKLKKFPRGYEATGGEIDDYVKHKSWYLQADLSYELILDREKLINQSAELFRLMKPFNDYLNKALTSFELPKR